MIYLLCLDNNHEKWDEKAELFKKNVKENVILISERRFTNLIVKNFSEYTKGAHVLAKELYYRINTIISLSIAMIALGSKHPNSLERIEKCIELGFMRHPNEFPEGVSFEKLMTTATEPYFRTISRNFIDNVIIIKLAMKSKTNNIEEWCNNLNFIVCKYIEKCNGKLIIKLLEENLAKAIKEKQTKQSIQMIKTEIVNLNRSMKICKESKTELADMIMSHIRILNAYVYSTFCIDIFTKYKFNETFLVILSAEMYSLYINLLGADLKDRRDMLQVRVFGDADGANEDPELKMISQNHLKMAEDYAKEVASELLEDENNETRKKINKIEKEREREKKRREALLLQEEQGRIHLKLQQEQEEKEKKEREEKEKYDEDKLIHRRFITLIKEELVVKFIDSFKEPEIIIQDSSESICSEESFETTNSSEHIESPKLDSVSTELGPDNFKISSEGLYLTQEKYEVYKQELDTFKKFPFFYIQNPNAFIFNLFDTIPNIYNQNEIKAFTMAKELPCMWSKLQTSDYLLRDQYYTEFRNFEYQIIHIMNLEI